MKIHSIDNIDIVIVDHWPGELEFNQLPTKKWYLPGVLMIPKLP